MELTRYRLERIGLVISANGPWVHYRDYAALQARLAACEADKAKAEARVQALEARLEIDHAYDQDMQRIEIPVEQRDKFPDGIACRDATIQLQDERVKELEQENARLREALEEIAGKGVKFDARGTHSEWVVQRAQHALEGG